MTRAALIGYTGFVGSNLARQREFAATYNSKNIEAIAGERFDLAICAGVSAVKWQANQDPDRDWAGIQRLIDGLDRARIGRLVLISTVDVYKTPVGVDEITPITVEGLHPYGKHRHALETWARDRFSTQVLRLPGLFGPGLKKNAIYDLLCDRRVEFIPPGGIFQFYNLARLSAHIDRVLELGLPVVNFAVEPIAIAEIAREIFQRELPGQPTAAPPKYDMRTRYFQELGGFAPGYLRDRAQTLAELKTFVASQKNP